jgi:hypothetical protein
MANMGTVAEAVESRNERPRDRSRRKISAAKEDAEKGVQTGALRKAKAWEISNFRFEISNGRKGKCQCNR